MSEISFESVLAAEKRIRPYVRHTPMIRADRLPRDTILQGFELYFKLETLQVTGSFKIRGAMNKLLQIPVENRANGLITASGGNHGKAVAYAAQLIDVPSQIFIPLTTPEEKADQMRAVGAKVFREGNVLDEASDAAWAEAKKARKCYIHGFKDPEVIAGQGTLGLEILKDLKGVDTVLIATGGGGMLAGVAMTIKENHPDVKILGVEPEGAPTLTKALEAGEPVVLPKVNTKAGTLALASTSDLNFFLVQQNVDDMILVSDEEMLTAAQWLWKRFHIAAELSASAGMAALLTQKYKPAKDEKVCVILCGAGDDGIF